MEPLRAIECVDDPSRAGVLLAPLRAEIAHQLASPASATEVADRLGLPRQKVNYHVRQLAEAGFLRRAGQRRKRNMIEQRWVATAKSYLLTPEVLPPLRPRAESIPDRLSSDYLLALAAQLESELGTARREADQQGKRLSTLSIHGEIAFESASQRAAFAEALQTAVTAVVSEFSSPPAGSPGDTKTRPFRLVVGCYPLPAGAESAAQDLPNEDPQTRGENE